MQAQRFYSTAKITVLAAALALSGAAFAASGQTAGNVTDTTQSSAAAASSQSTAPAATGDITSSHGKHRRHGMHKRMRDVGMWVPGYGPLPKSFLASLSLTDAQTTLIDDARQQQEKSKLAHRQEMRDAHKARMEQLKAKKMDPKQALASMEKQQQQAHDERATLDDKWLAVWDALDDVQHDKIASHFSARAEKFAQHAQQRKQHRVESQAEQDKVKTASESTSS